VQLGICRKELLGIHVRRALQGVAEQRNIADELGGKCRPGACGLFLSKRMSFTANNTQPMAR
jgi:hypothetical protein